MRSERTRLGWILVLAASGCGGGGDAPVVTSPVPVAPGAPASGAPPAAAPATPPSPGPAPAAPAPPPGAAPAPGGSAFTIELPIEPADAATAAYGLWPFGVHGGGHAADGHPGWDLEYRLGGTVRAAAAGTVQSLHADPQAPGRTTIQLQHLQQYRTVYTNVEVLASGIQVGAAVTAGQPLGTAGSQTLTMGTRPVTFAMVHFQLDDFSKNDGATNPNAVNPEPYLSPTGRAAFSAIWATAAYSQELVEPLTGNSRGATFPLARAWTLQQGAHATRIDFTKPRADQPDLQYALVSAAGVVQETGTATVVAVAGGVSTVDLVPQSAGAARLGVYSVEGPTLRLDYGAPGAPRPAGLGSASTYATP